MKKANKKKPKIKKKTATKSSTASVLKERLNKLQKVERKESFESDEHAFEFGLYSFDSGLKKKYQKLYKGKKLEKHYNGTVVKNRFGTCYSITDSIEVNINYSTPEATKQKLTSELRVIDGVGDFYAQQLSADGYSSVHDLTKHFRFGRCAKEFVELLSMNKGLELQKWLERRFPKSHPSVFLSSTFHSLEDFLFVDIESLGLHGYPLFLIGVAYFEKQKLIVEQILARDMDEEASALSYLNEKSKKKNVLGSFNGKSFDIPFIKQRMGYYNVTGSLGHPHFDMLHFSNRAFKGKYEDCKLITLENKLFRVTRKDHVPSFLVPDYYNSYLKSKNIGTLIPIIEHNKQDIISTVKIFGKLHELWG